MSDILRRLDGETEDQCIWRIGNAKNNGMLGDMTWVEIASFLNKEFREDDTKYYDSSAYRKKYKNFADAYDGIFSKTNFTATQMSEYEDQKKELFIAKKQFEDQRREAKKYWTAEARFNHLTDKLVDAVEHLCEIKPLEFNDTPMSLSSKDAVLSLADWHFGMTTDNIWNKYNVEICRNRVTQLVTKTIRYLRQHDVHTLHILLLGDAAHGSIHTSCRVASEEDTCDQLMQVSEIIAEVVNRLSEEVCQVNVYSTYGNHLRTVQNKHDSAHSDNMEKIIPWWLEQRLQSNNRVKIIKSDYYEFIHLNVLGYDIVAAHGDLEKFKSFGVTVNTLFTKKYGRTIDYTISADKHHIEEFETMGIESILVRSLCGTDEYANNIRAYSAPGQTLMIFSQDEGRECTYNIKLD